MPPALAMSEATPRVNSRTMGRNGVDLRPSANRAWVRADWLVPGLGLGLVQRLAHGQGRLAQRRTWPVTARSARPRAVGDGGRGCTAQALFVGVPLRGPIATALPLGRRSRLAPMPYGPGLCLGGLYALFWC